MAKLNYATEYLQTLEQMFPYVLYFGDLFATPNNGRFRWVNSRVIEVPTISTTGRTDGDRDTMSQSDLEIRWQLTGCLFLWQREF